MGSDGLLQDCVDEPHRRLRALAYAALSGMSEVILGFVPTMFLNNPFG